MSDLRTKVLASFLDQHMTNVGDEISNKSVARELGYSRPEIIAMFRRGEVKVPLDKAPDLAKAIGADPTHLFCLALDQFWPGARKFLEEAFSAPLTANERKLLDIYRASVVDADEEISETTLGEVKSVLSGGSQRSLFSPKIEARP